MIPYKFTGKLEFNCLVEELESILPFAVACESRPVLVNLETTDHMRATQQVDERDANAFAVMLIIDHGAAVAAGVEANPEEWICDCSDRVHANAMAFLIQTIIVSHHEMNLYIPPYLN